MRRSSVRVRLLAYKSLGNILLSRFSICSWSSTTGAALPTSVRVRLLVYKSLGNLSLSRFSICSWSSVTGAALPTSVRVRLLAYKSLGNLSLSRFSICSWSSVTGALQFNHGFPKGISYPLARFGAALHYECIAATTLSTKRNPHPEKRCGLF